MGKYREYTDQDIIDGAKEVKSVAALCRHLGLRDVGGNFRTIKRKLQLLGVDTSHWTGQAWNRGEQLKDWSHYTKSSNLKKHLLKLRGSQCESCSLTEWLSMPIALEIDHIDGNHTNNELSNIRLLCPNCHSLTPTWRGRKNKQ